MSSCFEYVLFVCTYLYFSVYLSIYLYLSLCTLYVYQYIMGKRSLLPLMDITKNKQQTRDKHTNKQTDIQTSRLS